MKLAIPFPTDLLVSVLADRSRSHRMKQFLETLAWTLADNPNARIGTFYTRYKDAETALAHYPRDLDYWVPVTLFQIQLDIMGACREARRWVAGQSLEEAWEVCDNAEWMQFLLDAFQTEKGELIPGHIDGCDGDNEPGCIRCQLIVNPDALRAYFPAGILREHLSRWWKEYRWFETESIVSRLQHLLESVYLLPEPSAESESDHAKV